MPVQKSPSIFLLFRIVLNVFLFVISLNASAVSRFVHPGLLHSQDDINRIKKVVTEKEGPIYEGFKILLESTFSKMEYRMQGPVEEWGRAPKINTGQAQNDAKAAYQNALMWAITGKKPHANKSIEILNAWAGKLKKVSGIDGARQINMKVNRLIEDIGDGNWVHYLNIDHAFLKGRSLRSELFPDGSHPNENGYAAWAAAMEPVLAKLLGEEPVVPLK